jgi:surface polysaccharide O-acyltransferase-like enzyme
MGLHLWYLEVLLVFSIILLPLFRFLKTGRADKIVSGLSNFSSRPSGIYLFFIPIAIMEMLVNLQPKGIGMREFGGWSILTYLVFFITGYMIALSQGFTDAMQKMKTVSLALGVASTVTGYFVITGGGSDRAPLFAVLRAFNSWCWLCAIIGCGRTFLNFSNRFLEYANEAVLPFYIMH